MTKRYEREKLSKFLNDNEDIRKTGGGKQLQQHIEKSKKEEQFFEDVKKYLPQMIKDEKNKVIKFKHRLRLWYAKILY